MKKQLLLFFYFLLVTMLCTACRNPINYLREPSGQPETEWRSSDGSIVFSVGSTGLPTGKMAVDGETVEFCLITDMGSGMHLFAPEVMETMIETPESEYEYWLCSYKSKKKFTATVKVTTYYEVGEKITFYRVEPE